MNKLPNGWQIKKLKDISDITSSKRIYEWEYVSSGIPFYRGKEITALKSEQKIENFIYISEARYNELKEKYGVPNKGDILITAVGTIGNAYTIEDDKPFYFKDGNLLWIKNIKEYPKFLEYLFENNKKLFLYNSFGSSQHALTISKLENLSFYFPPLEEQKRIASALSKIDAYLENTIKLIEEKERFKSGIAQKLLNKEARFEGFNDEWEIVKLGDLGIITATGVDKKIRDNEIPIKLLNYLDVFNRNKLYEKEISYMTTATEKQLEKCNIRKGDLFITPSSEDREGIAKSSVAMEDFQDTVYSYHIIRVRFNKEIDLKFKSYMCDTDFFHRQAYRLSDGMGQRYFISLNNFRNIEICIPKSIEEQKIIGEYLSLLDAEIDNLKEQKEEIKKMKSGIIKKLMSGEVRL